MKTHPRNYIVLHPLFEELFWNVRHRLKDGLFMADLLGLNRCGEVEDGLALMQIAYIDGALALAKAARLSYVAGNSESMAELYEIGRASCRERV